MLYFLQVLRGVAAVLVMFFHHRAFLNAAFSGSSWGDRLFGSGYIGVDIFFVISGFIMVYSTERTKGVREFFIRRFFRVVPLAWLATLMFYFQEGCVHSFSNLTKALLFIPQDYSAPPYFGYALYGVLWTITYELYFYTIFGVALFISHRRRVACAVCLIAAMMLIFQYALTQRFSFDAHNAPLVDFTISWLPMQITGVAGNPISWEFVAGMFLAIIYIRLRLSISRLSKLLLIVIAFILLGAAYDVYWSPSFSGQGLMGKGLGAVLLVAGLLIFDLCRNDSKKARGIWLYVGAISYPLYLVHNGITDRIWTKLGPFKSIASHMPPLVVLGLYVAMAFLLAVVVHHLVELPLQNAGRSLVEKCHIRKSKVARSPLFSISVWGVVMGALLVLFGAAFHIHWLLTNNFIEANPSFESGMTGWMPSNAEVAEITTSKAKSGLKALHLVTSGVRFIESKPLTVPEGRLRLDVWVYVNKGACRIELLAGEKRELVASALTYEGGGWKRLTAVSAAPIPANVVYVSIDDYHTAAEIFVDDMSLRRQW